MHASHGDSRNHSRATVIGGSISGLLAARVLSDHFDQVTILDRDRFPEQPGFRSGVPQSRHIHVLLPGGRQLLDSLMPGFTTELYDAGAERVQWPRDVLWLTAAGWSDRYEHDGDMDVVGMSREMIEWHIRRRIMAMDRIEVRESRNVTGLIPSEDGTRVVGVRHTARGTGAEQGQEAEELRSNIVVDASGRNSRTPRWLGELGYETPHETQINSNLGYSSRLFRRPPGQNRDWKVQFLQPSPPEHVRGGVIFPIDDNRWIVTVIGTGDDAPPTDEEGFLEFARSLRVPTLYESIKNAEPLSPVYGYRRTENQLRHYDRMDMFPEQLLITGDAACAFNPIYGQGMSVAAFEATVLGRELTEQRKRQPDGDLTGVAQRFQRAVASSVADAWLIATSDDLRYPTTEGAQADVPTRLMHRYLDRVIQTATSDREVNRALTMVFGMQRRPTSLFRPTTVARTLFKRGAVQGHDPYPRLSAQ